MEASILHDCEAEDKEVSYLDVPEFVTNIKEELISTEEPKFTDCIQNKEECLSIAEGQLLYNSNLCSENDVKIEPAENEKNDEFHGVEEMHTQDAEARHIASLKETVAAGSSGDQQTRFYEKLDQYYLEKVIKRPFTKQKISEIIDEIKVAKLKKGKKESREYFLLRTYDIATISDRTHLIKKHDGDEIEVIVAYEDFYEKLYNFHVNKTPHGGRCKMQIALKNEFIIPRAAIEIFVQCCERCVKRQDGRNKVAKKGFNERGEVNLLDFQSLPDGNYKWILSYQDEATKFLFLRPIETKQAEEVASSLLGIFLLIGAPKILQSPIGREFVSTVVAELKRLWPECILVHGRPSRPPQRLGSIQRPNQDVQDMIHTWMCDSNSNRWSVGIQFVQWQKNCSFNNTIQRSPYKALLGCEPRMGLASSNIPSDVAEKLTTEEELMEIMEEDGAVSELPAVEDKGNDVGLEVPMKCKRKKVVSSDNVGDKKRNTRSGKTAFKCDKCYYETRNEIYFEKHILFAKHVSHECSICGYKTTKIGNYKRHLISHESKEGHVHKCLECQYQIADEFAIYKHMAEHSSPNNGTPTACQQCDHGTFDTLFGSQMLTIESEVKEFYYQKCKKEDKLHVFSNESITEVNIYKCSECKYQTKRKGNLVHHMLRHKDPNELEMFACTECSYQSFNKSHLQTHSLTHKDGSEVTLYRCTQCEYHSKYKADLRVHLLRHKKRSEVPMFKCNECAYQAIRKCDLNRHLLRHKSAKEVRMHRCPECKYETFDKGNLNKHVYRHRLGVELEPIFNYKVLNNNQYSTPM